MFLSDNSRHRHSQYADSSNPGPSARWTSIAAPIIASLILFSESNFFSVSSVPLWLNMPLHVAVATQLFESVFAFFILSAAGSFGRLGVPQFLNDLRNAAGV